MTSQNPPGTVGEPAKSAEKRRLRTPMPKWVIAFGVVSIVLVAAFLIVHLAGGLGAMAMKH